MRKEVKTIVGVILGGIIGFILIDLFSEADSSTMSNVIPFIVGALITFVIIVFVKNQMKKSTDHE